MLGDFAVPCTVRVLVLIVTNSSAAEGWMPMVLSKVFFVAPALSAIAIPCMISGASGPTLQHRSCRSEGQTGNHLSHMWQPTTLSVSACTISFIRVFSSRPDSVYFIGRNLET